MPFSHLKGQKRKQTQHDVSQPGVRTADEEACNLLCLESMATPLQRQLTQSEKDESHIQIQDLFTRNGTLISVRLTLTDVGMNGADQSCLTLPHPPTVILLPHYFQHTGTCNKITL
jgi:hypothetical protein